ncbi:MAG: 8-oxoguanine DNA glycosylase [Clostridiales Family XIII bacterium]|jgi:N-glycosylase/DNA lyase|nr:8-oxoguanine DNA glycosylase [Clostridiales Family XIII bacterium]
MAPTRELTKFAIESVRDFDAAQIFESGQCFRFSREPDGSYTGVVRGCFANISYDNEEDRVAIWSDYMPMSDALRERFWRNFLDLDRDYREIKRALSDKDPIMEKAVTAGGGLRVLNQEPWETLISFIISQNSNIPRIRGCIEALCAKFGQRIGSFENRGLYAFPTVAELASANEESLGACKLGYRARYIAEAARQVNIDGGAFLDTADEANTQKAEEYLLSLSGVGPKVAHCVMLFSLKKADIFPIDVWIARAMNRLYGIAEDDHEAMRAYAQGHFSPWGGIAQTYLFDYIRRLGKDAGA